VLQTGKGASSTTDSVKHSRSGAVTLTIERLCGRCELLCG
jgi:hypothetical protein